MAVTDMINPAARHEAVRQFISRLRAHWGYTIVLLLTCAIVVAIAVHNYRTTDRELTNVTLSRRLEVAQLASTVLSEKFGRLVDVTVSLATRVRFRELVAEGKWVEASEILRAAPRDFPFIERLFLTNVEGTLMADVPELPGVRGVNFAQRDWYKGVRHDWRPYVSPVYKRAATPQLDVFAVAAPIKNATGGVSGILVMQVSLEGYFGWAREIDIGPGGFVYIVDSKGRVAFNSKPPAQGEIRDYSGTPIVQKLLRAQKGVEIGLDPVEREESIAAYAPVAGYGWGVVVRQPARTSVGLAARDEQLRLIGGGYSLILALFIASIHLASRAAMEHRRAEEDRRIKAELERRVAERTAQLEVANKELESFSYSVSHDLRSPLRAIDGFSRILEQDHGTQLDNECRRLLGVIRDSSRKMGQLIDDLLEFSRIGRKSLSAAAIDMKRLVEEVLAELEIPEGKRPRLLIGVLPPVRGDAALIRQVWANLLSNAIKFSGRREQPVIQVSGHGDGAESVYCVKDNGAGFDMRYYDKLFGVFQRLHSAEEFDGTGVGLAIVQRVVTRHGGRVWAESKVNGGAAFYFSLPRGGQDGQV